MGSKIMGQDKMIAIIDYNMGNLRSVSKAFELLGGNVIITNKANEIHKADYIVLPGVGAFADGMKQLKKLKLIEVLTEEVVKKGKPFMGICLGMQLLARDSEEFGKHNGLGWVDASVKAFNLKEYGLKVPHVGWNDIEFSEDCPLFKDIKNEPNFYFVHSYHIVCDDSDMVIATCEYGIKFIAAIQKNNIIAVQFHPEKSQIIGLKLIDNFLDL